MAWQRIETAPHGVVDLWCTWPDGSGKRYPDCRLQPDSDEGDFWVDCDGYRISNHGCNPTHLMTPPPPPK